METVVFGRRAQNLLALKTCIGEIKCAVRLTKIVLDLEKIQIQKVFIVSA